jgi:heavy metal translocating P-type ATPase
MSGACEYLPPLRENKFSEQHEKERHNERVTDIIRFSTLGIVAIFISWLQLLQPVWLANIVIVIAVIGGGYPLFKESLYALKKGRVNMELSMVIAIVASLVLLQFLPAIVITFFALLSEFVEGFIVEKGRRNIQALYDLAPRRAIIKRKDGDNEGKEHTETVEVEAVGIGDIVIVREGDIIPVDGVILRGTSMVDQSSITGESVPIEKREGDLVFAGTINPTHQLEVECKKVSSDTTYARIIHLVEEAEASKAPIQKLSDRMATRLIQFAIGLSALTYIITGNVISTLSVIVVAGACGLAVGTPIALLATTGKLSRRGVIVKGGLQIEKLKDAGIIVFDKTGTLTYGKPFVSQVISFDPSIEPKKVLECAAIAESNVNHPLARAIEEKARQEKITVPTSIGDTASSVTVGRGVTRMHDGHKITVGNLRQMRETFSSTEDKHSSSFSYHDPSLQESLLHGDGYQCLVGGKESRDDEEFARQQITSATTVYVALDHKIVGAILFKDMLRSEAEDAISEIKSMGMHVVMLTGDDEKVAKQIADEAGIDEYYADLLPQDKISKIEKIVQKRQEQSSEGKVRRKRRTVVMVGDGINDAPALAKADVGIAMGRTGTDVAAETADVVLMTEDLKKIPYLVRASRQSVFTIKENFLGTLSVDGIGFVLAATGQLNPLIAAFIHIASELVFMVNSARLIIENDGLTNLAVPAANIGIPSVKMGINNNNGACSH